MLPILSSASLPYPPTLSCNSQFQCVFTDNFAFSPSPYFPSFALFNRFFTFPLLIRQPHASGQDSTRPLGTSSDPTTRFDQTSVHSYPYTSLQPPFARRVQALVPNLHSLVSPRSSSVGCCYRRCCSGIQYRFDCLLIWTAVTAVMSLIVFAKPLKWSWIIHLFIFVVISSFSSFSSSEKSLSERILLSCVRV